MTRIAFLKKFAFAALFAAGGFVTAAHGENEAAQPAVIELFTSQGCSSCPAADRLLQELSKRPGVIAMSFPVTYWDYLGWKDTLARQENSRRQRDYAATRGDGEVYTPQIVVNGIKRCVGSNLAAIEAAVHTTQSVMQKVDCTASGSAGRWTPHHRGGQSAGRIAIYEWKGLGRLHHTLCRRCHKIRRKCGTQNYLYECRQKADGRWRMDGRTSRLRPAAPSRYA